jgi:uncharacterized membrane protein
MNEQYGPPDSRNRHSVSSRIRNSFLTGLVIAAPLAITLYLTWWFVNLIDGWVKPLIPRAYLPDNYLPFAIPGLGIVVAFLGLTLLGFLTANLVGRGLINLGESALEQMPIVRGLYKGVKQIFETIFSSNGTTFRKAGLVEFPVKGTWSIVFIAAPPSGDIEARLPGGGTADGEEHIGVFMPCTPNPTTGYFFYLPRKDVVELSISVEAAAKLVMSAGMIQPKGLV